MRPPPRPKNGPKLASVSPSQIKEFRLCPRKHWLNKRAGIPQPEQPHLQVGTAAHGAMEEYFETGEMFDPDATASTKFVDVPELQRAFRTALHSGARLLLDPDSPKPKAGLLVETPRNYNTGLKVANVALRQRSDLLDPTESVAKSYDWKTSAKVFSDYSKTGEELARDEQGVLYAYEALEKYKADAVIFTHGVMGTQQVEFDLISTPPMTREHVREELLKLEEIVSEMVSHYAIDNFFDTRPGKGAPSASWGSPCRAFKGCPYTEYCGVELPKADPEPTEEPSMKMSFKERLARAQLSTGVNPPDAAKPAPFVPYDPEAATNTTAVAATDSTPAPAPGASAATAATSSSGPANLSLEAFALLIAISTGKEPAEAIVSAKKAVQTFNDMMKSVGHDG